MFPPPLLYDIDNILVPESCEIVGDDRLPACPSIVTPDLIFAAIIFACSASAIFTVPPEVYPAGIVTVPAFVEILPLVLPLFAMLPEMLPEAPYAVFVVKISPLAASAADVS